MKKLYCTKSGRYAEVHEYQEPCFDDDGMPDGWNTVYEVYTFENDYTKEFVTRTFVNKINVDLFLKMNGYDEVVK